MVPILNDPTYDSKFLVEGFCPSVNEKAQRAVEDFKCLSPVFTSPTHVMLQFLLGFTLCNIVGMYLTQNCDITNLAKQSESQNTP